MGLEECIGLVADRWRLKYVVFYGSRARGYGGPHSDYDLAVKAGRRLSLGDRGLLYSELGECVDGALDLVFIDDWNPIVVWEALTWGRLVYTCGPSCTKEYYYDLAKAIDEVADLQPLIDLFRREYRRALTRLSS